MENQSNGSQIDVNMVVKNQEVLISQNNEIYEMLRGKKVELPHLTKKETAEFFGVSVNCITDWTRNGTLKSYAVGQRVYFKRSEVLEALFSNCKSA